MSFRLSSHHAEAVHIPAGTAVSTRRSVAQESDRVHHAARARHPAVGVADRADGRLRRRHRRPDRRARPRRRVPGVQRDRPSSTTRSTSAWTSRRRRRSCWSRRCARSAGTGSTRAAPRSSGRRGRRPGGSRARSSATTPSGLNVSGAIELHVPDGHDDSVVGGTRGGLDPLPRGQGRPAVPLVARCWCPSRPRPSAATSRRRTPSRSGTSRSARPTARPGQVLRLGRTPPVVLDRDGPARAGGRACHRRTASARPTWEEWVAVDDFGTSTPTDRHVTVDPTTGEVRFGPPCGCEDGSERRFGAIPARGAALRVRGYRTGGGARGNVAARTVSVLRSSIPYVAAVYNRRAAAGGVDGEDVENARAAGPLELRGRGRAVTVEDYVAIVHEAAPELARVHCVPGDRGRRRRRRPHPRDPRRAGPGRPHLAARPPAARRCPRARAARPGRHPGGRGPAERRAAQLCRASGSTPGCGRVPRPTPPRSSATRSPRSTGTSTRWPAVPTAPAGRSAVRCSPVRCTGCSAGSPGSTTSRTSSCSAPTRSTGSISSPQDRVDLGDTHVVLSVEHSIVVRGRCVVRGPPCAARRRRRRRWSTGSRRRSSAATSPSGWSTRSTTSSASVGATLDDLDAYVDPRYAPDDFVRWVASWLSPAIAARRDADHLRAHLGDLRRALLGRGTLRRGRRGGPRVHGTRPGRARLRRGGRGASDRRGRSRGGPHRCSRWTCGSLPTSPTPTPSSTSCGSSSRTSDRRTSPQRCGGCRTEVHRRDRHADRHADRHRRRPGPRAPARTRAVRRPRRRAGRRRRGRPPGAATGRPGTGRAPSPWRDTSMAPARSPAATQRSASDRHAVTTEARTASRGPVTHSAGPSSGRTSAV